MGRTAELKIFAGNSNPPLAAEISQYLKVPLGKATVPKQPTTGSMTASVSHSASLGSRAPRQRA